MTELTEDADYDASEMSEKVPSPLSDAGNYADYVGQGTFYSVALTTRPSCTNEVNPFSKVFVVYSRTTSLHIQSLLTLFFFVIAFTRFTVDP
ncbi:unnamed protein product [Protopolystoma xenopodis]|uniref:Uncharacterized protein n=1 Tax=Protopolystoma xenopodis TaxID=117903 RepID=A0A448XL23_9PLAT|nr:unnamed protein product [Protopolystoma xenopodis]